ncbi:MAG: putative phage tail protein [Dokdonella sp.]|uniref:putative phage tail protein n=1 Tax=Dokdonella sp. TaxID=2291710 RepID=UPI003F8119E0
MSAPLHQAADYAGILQQLLPRGRAWPRDPDTTQAATMQGLAPTFSASDAAAIGLLVDLFPATAVGMLAEWQQTLGLPGLLGYTGSDVPTEQAQVVAALVDSGGQSAAYFIALAASLGLTITITGYLPATVDSPVDAPIYGIAWAHAWRVNATIDADYSILRVLFERYKPAHTAIVWAVPIGLLLSEETNHLLTESGDRLLLEY